MDLESGCSKFSRSKRSAVELSLLLCFSRENNLPSTMFNLCRIQYKQCMKGQINHWANRENARGLALEYQNTPLVVFQVFSYSQCVKFVELFDYAFSV